MMNFIEEWLAPIGFGVAAILMALAVVGSFAEAQQWERFAQKHNCKVVAKMSPTLGTGFSTSGNVTTVVVNGKTSYLCDDGVTYTR